jgi:plasmid stabilization system protein ParE
MTEIGIAGHGGEAHGRARDGIPGDAVAGRVGIGPDVEGHRPGTSVRPIVNVWVANDLVGGVRPNRDVVRRRGLRLRILATIKRLKELPRLGHVGRARDSCEMLVVGLPFVVVYRINADAGELVILGIFHTARLR